MSTNVFHWADYLVFGASLLVSAGIGVYFAIVDRKKPSNDEFLTGGRNMHPFPVAMSMVASLLNAVFIVGVPAEVHYNGAIFLLNALSYVIVIPIAAHFIAPVFHSMNLTSAYEYLERRFSLPVRLAGSLTFAVSLILFLSVVLYTPALAFSQVTGVEIWILIVACGTVCTFYTVMGGIKAVIWTDTLQMTIILIGLIVLPIMAAVKIGSTQKIVDAVQAGGRLNFNNFDPNPKVRHTFWTMTLGYAFINLQALVSNQMIVQRYFVIKSIRKVQIAVYFILFLIQILAALVGAVGLIMYAYYSTCDPLVKLTGGIKAPDQIVPLFMMEILGPYHGIPGLLTASIFAAALSSISSAINSLSAVFLEDFLKPLYIHVKKAKISERKAAWTTRILSIVFGVITIGLAFSAQFMGDKIVQIQNTIWGATGSPLAAVFIAGFFLPFCESWGVLTGLVVGMSLSLWVSIGNIIYGKKVVPLVLGTNCSDFKPPVPPPSYVPVLEDWYNISYAWYGLIGFCSTLIVACVVSLIRKALTGESYKKRTPTVEAINEEEHHPDKNDLNENSKDSIEATTYNNNQLSEKGHENKAFESTTTP